MKKNRRKVINGTNLDAIKAMHKGGREAEQQMLGPGFHSFSRIHLSQKTYTRKTKHKSDMDNCD